MGTIEKATSNQRGVPASYVCLTILHIIYYFIDEIHMILDLSCFCLKNRDVYP